jgi:CBS-domain-containing membrane protein
MDKKKSSLLRTAGGSRPPHYGTRAVLLGGLGGFIAIGTLAMLGAGLEVLLLLGSFGASCVLLFGFPDAPFSQPANVIGGHFFCTVIGIAALQLLGPVPGRWRSPSAWPSV